MRGGWGSVRGVGLSEGRMGLSESGRGSVGGDGAQ